MTSSSTTTTIPVTTSTDSSQFGDRDTHMGMIHASFTSDLNNVGQAEAETLSALYESAAAQGCNHIMNIRITSTVVYDPSSRALVVHKDITGDMVHKA